MDCRNGFNAPILDHTGFETWSNWDCKGHKYIPLPSGVNPKCDDMFVTIEPHTVQSVEFQTRAKPKGK